MVSANVHVSAFGPINGAGGSSSRRRDATFNRPMRHGHRSNTRPKDSYKTCQNNPHGETGGENAQPERPAVGDTLYLSQVRAWSNGEMT